MQKLEEKKEIAKIHIVRAKLSDLAALKPVHRFGRYMDLKITLQQEMKDTPEGEFAILQVAAKTVNDKREKLSIYNALNKLARENGWHLRWSQPAKGFLLVRRKDWKDEKIKVGREK